MLAPPRCLSPATQNLKNLLGADHGFPYARGTRAFRIEQRLQNGVEPILQYGALEYESPALTLVYNDHHGIEAQLAGNYIGVNNTLNRPSYTMFNGFVSKDLTRTTTVTVGASNLFNENVQLYGYFGHQLEAATNQYQAPASTPIRQAVV